MVQMFGIRRMLAAAMFASALGLAGCSDPPQTVSTTTYEQSTTAPQPVAMQPGSVTTQTTHTQTVP